jgi:hypothetical protein
MKTYKDTNNNLWAYELDGSQDHLIPSDFIQITDDEANAIRAEQQPVIVIPEPTKNELLAELEILTAKINALEATLVVEPVVETPVIVEPVIATPVEEVTL